MPISTEFRNAGSTRGTPAAPPPTRGVRCAQVVAFAAAAMAMACGQAAAVDCMSAPEAGIDWQKCDKSNVMLRGGDLAGAKLDSTDFSATDLRETNLAGASLQKATLVRASLAGAKADKANFSRVEAYRTGFAGISAAGASFLSAELQRADFQGANLTGANFGKAELGRANFSEAVLTGTTFAMANLSRAELTEAIFEGPIDFAHAFLFLTRLEGLDLSAATGLEQSQIDLACGDADTKLPAGLTPPSTWPCKFE